MFYGFPSDGLAFLGELASRNEKVWFDANKPRFEAQLVGPGKEFVRALLPRLQKIVPEIQGAPKVGGSIMRIHRDTRFSNDKSPYKTHFDCWFWTGADKGWESPGFFFRLTTATVMFGTGMHCFPKPMLEKYRRAVVADAATLQRALAGLRVGGRNYKRVPPGYDGGDPDLLRHDGLTVDDELPSVPYATTPALVEICTERFAAWAPVHRWLMRLV